MYISVKTNLPTMYKDKFGMFSSEILLVYKKKFDDYCLATYDQLDTDCIPQWYSHDSERWNITKDVSHWTTFERKT